MANEIKLIDFSALGEIANKLIDKLSDAIGWVATHESPSRIALSTYIEEIQSSDLPPLEKAARITRAKKDIKEYINQRDIIYMAASELSNDARPESIDNDWLDCFMDKAKHVSNEDFQFIWGRILAEECNAPGCVPKGLLFVLERMDREDAEKFLILAGLTVDISGSPSPLITLNAIEKYQRYNIHYSDMMDLEAIGLVKIETNALGNGFQLQTVSNNPGEANQFITRYFGNEYINPLGMDTLEVGNVVFSRIGEALYKAVVPKEVEGFWEEIVVPHM